jgi:hypothetical protein
MLCGVFQGSALGGALGSVVDAWRVAGVLRRHWYAGWSRERRSGESSLGGGMVVECVGLGTIAAASCGRGSMT